MPPDEPDNGDEATDDATIVRRRIDPDPSTAEYDLLDIIAELEGTDIETLSPLYNEIGHMMEALFEKPPSDRAQMSISFSYVGYRITVDRSGVLELVPVTDAP